MPFYHPPLGNYQLSLYFF